MDVVNPGEVASSATARPPSLLALNSVEPPGVEAKPTNISITLWLANMNVMPFSPHTLKCLPRSSLVKI